MSECQTEWVCPKCGRQFLKFSPNERRAFKGSLFCNCGFRVSVDMNVYRPELRKNVKSNIIERDYDNVVPLV